MISFADIQEKPSDAGLLETQVVRFNPWMDVFRRYLTDAPTPTKFAAWLKQVDRGDIAALCEIQEEMEAKDAWLKSVVGTRRRAITALDWEIVPDEDAKDQTAAEEAATYCEERLGTIPEFPTTLEHLSKSIGPNVSVAELVWDNAAELVGIVDVPGHRLRAHPYFNYGVYILLEPGISELLPTDIPNKFITYHHDWNGGYPFRTTYTHATVLPWLIKHFSLADWKSFLEIYGMPWRVGYFDETVSPQDRAVGKDMLEQMGSDTAATLPKGMTAEILEVTGKGEAFKDMIELQNKTLSILYLGQSLTTDVADSGSRALGQVHDNVRKDLLMSDIACESRVLREQLLRPMIELKFPGRDMPVPYFRRMVVDNVDRDQSDANIAKVTFARTSGLPLTRGTVYDLLGVSAPPGVDQEEVMFAEPVQTGQTGKNSNSNFGNSPKPGDSTADNVKT